jgi:hypothetical protein
MTMTKEIELAKQHGIQYRLTPEGTTEMWCHDRNVQAFAEALAAAERERLRGGHDLEAMCEAFHRLIEAHAQAKSPFHNPVVADAQIALRVLRGVVAGL